MHRPKQKEKILVEWLRDEALVYCHETHRVFCLNPICSKVFALCDGTHTRFSMANTLGELSADPAQRQAAVDNGLAILEEHGLLDPAHPLPRREFLVAASLLIPAVLAVTAPHPSMANSTECITSTQCSAGGFGCNQCDPCPSSPQMYCMQWYTVAQDNTPQKNPIHSSCVGESQRTGVPRQCENEFPDGHWNRDCNLARNYVINERDTKFPGQDIANYKCCFCS